jgi:hypothetical protein
MLMSAVGEQVSEEIVGPPAKNLRRTSQQPGSLSATFGDKNTKLFLNLFSVDFAAVLTPMSSSQSEHLTPTKISPSIAPTTPQPTPPGQQLQQQEPSTPVKAEAEQPAVAMTIQPTASAKTSPSTTPTSASPVATRQRQAIIHQPKLQQKLAQKQRKQPPPPLLTSAEVATTAKVRSSLRRAALAR